MEINNDYFMNFAVVVLVISILLFGFSLFNFVKPFTGYATDTAQTYVDVAGEASIEFTTNVTGWGTGAVNSSFDSAILVTNGTVTHGNWSSNNNPLYLENVGNVNASLDLKADSDADGFIGGTRDGGPLFQIKVTNNESNSCPTIGNFSSFQDIDTTDRRTCDEFEFTDTKDSLQIDIYLRVPGDAPPGNKTAIITATAEVV